MISDKYVIPIVPVRNNIDLVQYISVSSIENVIDHQNHRITRIFVFEEMRYLWNNVTKSFEPLGLPHEWQTVAQVCAENRTGIVDEERNHWLQYYGSNEIWVDVKSYWRLFVDEIVNPFYLFQVFSITLWSLDDYYYYAACVLLLSAISIGTSLYQTRKQTLTLRELVEKAKPDLVTVQVVIGDVDIGLRQIEPNQLVPDDILLVQGGLTMPCDCLLLEGTCLVNECMLTGESVPINKRAANESDANDEENRFNEPNFKRNIVYAGTEVIQIRGAGDGGWIRAKVLNVGFSTSKGKLIKSILYPKPIGFKLYRDSKRVVVALFCLALFGMFYSLRVYLRRHADFRTMFFGTLDVITIIVPPALPMAMTAGTIYSQRRLKSKGIFCVSPPQINVCGKMKLCCFDKTGTLTEDGLTLFGVLTKVMATGGKSLSDRLGLVSQLGVFDKFVQGMVTCHSLVVHNGDLLGDPLDLEMFKATDWRLCDPDEFPSAPRSVMPNSEWAKRPDGDVPYVIGIQKEFEFTSEHQCMSVLVQILGHRNYVLFTKGAPERVRQMVDPKSMPSNFNAVLSKYANSGYRILALAYREFSDKVKLSQLAKRPRSDMERDLQFLGLIVFQNRLKEETIPTVRHLKEAGMRLVMATGDNILTAVAVARESEMVAFEEKVFRLRLEEGSSVLMAQEIQKNIVTRRPQNVRLPVRIDLGVDNFIHHFAVDGETWDRIREMRPDLMAKILTRGTIFARFRPEQKSELVLELQAMDYVVAMCGDGANDCTALKVANVGVSLSQAEASVAAPFTYNKQNIECMKHLVLEGRCALVTSFAIFKYMVLYSVIQFSTILILYTYCSTLGNFQFLYIDLVVTASIAFSMGLQRPPSTKLVPERPSSSLISLVNVIPLLAQIATCVLLQVAAITLLSRQKWYPDVELQERCFHNETTVYQAQLYGGNVKVKTIVCWENSVIFLVSCFQYLVLGLIYSKGRQFRRPFYTNGK